jgi:hypothetical protein
MRKISVRMLILFLFLGAIIGSAVGKLIAFILPDGVVKQFFIKSATIGFKPVAVNLGFINFTFGFEFILNVIGVVAIAFVAYLLRWYQQNRY